MNYCNSNYWQLNRFVVFGARASDKQTEFGAACVGLRRGPRLQTLLTMLVSQWLTISNHDYALIAMNH